MAFSHYILHGNADCHMPISGGGGGGLDMVYVHVTLIAFLTWHSMIAPMLIAYIATLDLEPGIEQVPRGTLASLSTCFYASLSSCSYMHLYSSSVDRQQGTAGYGR